MTRCKLRFSALAVAATLALSCLLTGCGSSGGGSSTPTQNNASTGETTASDFTYNAQEGIFEGKDGSTIKVTEPSAEDENVGVAQVLERTYETPSKETIEEKGSVTTAETIKQDANGDVMSVASTYAVASTAFSSLASNPAEAALINEGINELNTLISDAENDEPEAEEGEGEKEQEPQESANPSEGTDGEEESVTFYKFMVEYHYQDSKLDSATLYVWPYTAEVLTPESAPLMVSYKVESTASTSTFIVDEKNTTENLENLTLFDAGTIVTAFVHDKDVIEAVRLQGENAIVQAQGTIKQVEKAKWKITKSTSENRTVYSLAEQISPYHYLRKEEYSGTLMYCKYTSKSETKTSQTYEGIWSSSLSNEPSSLIYLSYPTGNTTEVTQCFDVTYSYPRIYTETGERPLGQVWIRIGDKQDVTTALEQYNAVYKQYPYPKRADYEYNEQFQEAWNEVEQNRYAAYAQIQNSVVLIYDDGVYDDTIGVLGTDETIKAVKEALIEQYPGDEELSDDMPIDEILAAWEESLRSIAWETRNQVDMLLG